MKKYYLLTLFILMPGILTAQEEFNIYPVSTPSSFLVMQQSPLFLGAGQIGAAVPMQDPLGFYLNPAQLGYFSQKYRSGFLITPQKVKLPRDFGFHYPYSNYGAAISLTSNKKSNFPLSIGTGFLYSELAYNNLYCLSLGGAYNYYLKFNFGVSVKSFNYKTDAVDESGLAFDIGTMFTVPVSKLFFDNIKYSIAAGSSYLKPKFELTLGYSLTNLGDGVEKTDGSYLGNRIWQVIRTYKYPNPRTARLGYNLDFGVDMINDNKNITTISFSFTAEAEDLLVEFDQKGGFTYQSVFGKIIPVKHLLKHEKNRDIVIHRGNILKLFETLYITSGRYYVEYLDNFRSYGYGFSSEGIFKLLTPFIENSVIEYITDHIVVEYYDVYNYVGVRDTNFQGLAFYLKGI